MDIQEIAQAFAYKYRREHQDLSGQQSEGAYDGFIAGAELMREDLTRWHDPKEELPRDDSTVLCKVARGTETDYLTLVYSRNAWWMFEHGIFRYSVLAWRPIHE